jgi:two-component system, LytTR family, sensor kinase
VSRQRVKQFGLILGLWTATGFFYGCEIYFLNAHVRHSIDLHDALFRALPDMWIYAILTPVVLRFYSRFPFQREKWPRLLAIHVVAVAAYLVIWSALKVAVYPVDDLLRGIASPRDWNLFRLLLLHNAHDALWFYGTTVAVSEVLRYQGKCRERETRAAKLQSQLAHAQLRALKMQLDPHFLFNTLHAVSSLMHEDASAACKTVEQLSDLLRLSFESGNEQEVTLRREMEFLEGYLEIQKTRLRDRLNVHLHLDPGTLDALVPNMILQPLVENAVKYGIASRHTPGNIEIRAEELGSVLRLAITDDGPGLSQERLDQPGKGLGIANTRARLQQLYGKAHRFSLNAPVGGGMQVRLEIPFRLQEGKVRKEETMHAN